MVQGMAKLPVKDIRVRKLVQERQGLVLKADRCHYTEGFQREGSLAEIPKTL